MNSSNGFQPHEFSPGMRTMGFGQLDISMPTILVAADAAQKMAAYVEVAGKEVGWLGVMYRTGSSYFLKDVLLLKQKVHDYTTHITPDGLGDAVMELVQKPNGDELVDALRFWGHSHVMMEVNPSAQDDAQMDVLGERQGVDWFVRGIFNKHGKAKFWVYDYKVGVIYDDVPWRIVAESDAALLAAVRKEYATKVQEVSTWAHLEAPKPQQSRQYGRPQWGRPAYEASPTRGRGYGYGAAGEDAGQFRPTIGLDTTAVPSSAPAATPAAPRTETPAAVPAATVASTTTSPKAEPAQRRSLRDWIRFVFSFRWLRRWKAEVERMQQDGEFHPDAVAAREASVTQPGAAVAADASKATVAPASDAPDKPNATPPSGSVAPAPSPAAPKATGPKPAAPSSAKPAKSSAVVAAAAAQAAAAVTSQASAARPSQDDRSLSSTSVIPSAPSPAREGSPARPAGSDTSAR